MNCYKLFFLFKLGIVVGAFISDSHTMSETNAISQSDARFPAAFKFGAATAAYQIEGAWNVDGKGPNIWDTLCHEHPDLIADHLNGDVGPDSYNLYKQDILALKEIGFNFYRFSISWSRILPTGDVSSLNQKGIDYYNKLIDDLIAANIEPVATMLHYDLPQPLQDLGGYANPVIVGYFESYANILYSNFGDRVKTWITFNEPFDFCVDGYGTGNIAPLIAASGVGEYLCGHNVLLSHAAAYHVYKEKYFAKFNGKIGITLNSRFFYPKNENVTDDVIERALQYRLGWLANPIFSATGGYPPIMIEEIAINSLREGRDWSRLPPMDDVIKDYIKGSADFIGFNYYTSRLVELDKSTGNTATPPSWRRDSKILMTVDDKWTRAKSNWLYSVPKGLGDVLRWIKNEYNNPEVLITENGWSDDGQLNDNGRVLYLKEHLAEVLKATVHDNCNVTGYTVWSIIDNFEWLRGYTERFGLYSVDFNSAKKDRKAKLSAKYMNTLITTRVVPNGVGETNN